MASVQPKKHKEQVQISQATYSKCMYCDLMFCDVRLPDNNRSSQVPGCNHIIKEMYKSSLRPCRPPEDAVRRLVEICIWRGWNDVYFGPIEAGVTDLSTEKANDAYREPKWYGLPSHRHRVMRSVEEYMDEVSLWEIMTEAITEMQWKIELVPYNANKLARGAMVGIRNGRHVGFAASDAYSIRDAFWDCYHAALVDEKENYG